MVWVHGWKKTNPGWRNLGEGFVTARPPMENISGGFGQIRNHKVEGAREGSGIERTTQHNRAPFESRNTWRAGSSFRTASADCIFHLDFPVSPLDHEVCTGLALLFGQLPPIIFSTLTSLENGVIRTRRTCVVLHLCFSSSASLLPPLPSFPLATRRVADYFFHRR